MTNIFVTHKNIFAHVSYKCTSRETVTVTDSSNYVTMIKNHANDKFVSSAKSTTTIFSGMTTLTFI